MDQNIYYVGAINTTPTPNITQPSNIKRIRDTQLRTMVIDRNSNHNKVNYTRSTSSPKTERSTYAITLQKLRHKSPQLQLNTLNILNPNQPSKTDNRVLTARNTAKSQLSSAFKQVSVKPVVREKSRGGTLFRKVQQPRNRPKERFRVTDTTDYKAQYGQNNHKLANIPSITNNNQYKPQHQNDQSQLSIQQHYKLQPLKKLFLCTRCYQFTPIIQLKSHHLNCRIPLNKQQFVNKWLKIINLLKQILRQHNTNPLYRLIDRMEWYISQCQIGHRQGYILYSQELACVLSLKSSIVLQCVGVDDLFWLIEAVGDLIQTKAIDLEETAFWKICT